MNLVVDPDHRGTPESAWKTSHHLAATAPLDWGRPRRVVVVSPHPDDEVLGAGGFLQFAHAHDVPIEVIAVTDGEASHHEPDFDLSAVRSFETREALARLGLGHVRRKRMRLPDGNVASHVDVLADLIARTLRPEDVCVAPWTADGHPDHDACGRAARTAAAGTGARYLGFLVWAWHWADPDSNDLPWSECRRVQLSRRAAARKRWSTHAFASQTRVSRAGPDETVVLPPHVLRRFYRPFEIFVEEAQ